MATRTDPHAPCCSEDCSRCSGEYCDTHFTDPCDCDVVERHTDRDGVWHDYPTEDEDVESI